MPHFLKLLFIKYEKVIKRVYYVLLAVTSLVTIYKDIAYSVPLPPALRNRVVGIRMLKDGLSPYFYICKTGGPIRYEDIFTERNSIVSQATASPFFHYIFGFMAEMPQFQINIFWIFLEYLTLIGCSFLAIFSLPKQYRKQAVPLVLTVMVAFTFTTGWIAHIENGQNYIFIPLLAIGSLYFLKKESNWFYVLMFAVFSASLILIRPVAILFFLPFVFYPKVYFKYGLAAFMVIAAYVLLVCCSPVQKTNWADYFKAVQVHIVTGQQPSEERPLIGDKFIPVTHFEGIDLESGTDLKKMDNFGKMTEDSNFYYFYNRLTSSKLSIPAMTFIGAAIVFLLLVPLVFFIKKRIYISTTSLFILGFVIYDLFTFCSPIPRSNYYWVEFLLPLLLMATCMKRTYILPVCCLVAGVCLNFPAHPWLPGKQNVGEVLIVIALLHDVYRPVFVSLFLKKKWMAERRINWL